MSLNLQRRHLSSTQKALVTPRVEGLLSKEAKKRHSEAISKSNQEKPRRTKYQDSYTEIFPELKKDSSVEIFPALKDAPQETLDASKKHGQEQNEARTQAAKLTGTNPHYVTDAKFIINRAPEVADFALKTGKIAMPDAKKIATLPEGLGATISQLKALCEKDREALDLIDTEITRKPGNPEPSGNNQYQKKEVVNHDNIMNYQTESRATQGTSIEYTLRRLRKDHPELHEKVLANELSPNAAAIEAGFRKKTVTITVDVEAIAKRARWQFGI